MEGPLRVLATAFISSNYMCLCLSIQKIWIMWAIGDTRQSSNPRPSRWDDGAVLLPTRPMRQEGGEKEMRCTRTGFVFVCCFTSEQHPRWSGHILLVTGRNHGDYIVLPHTVTFSWWYAKTSSILLIPTRRDGPMSGASVSRFGRLGILNLAGSNPGRVKPMT